MKKLLLFSLLLSVIISCNENKKTSNTSTEPEQSIDKKWWKEAIVYQIYPRSFQDTDGDGVGDLQGIINRLDYVKDLGVTAVWLNPIYSSPNDDNGYDVSDYRNIMSDFGTMEDFDTMLSEMHARDIKLVMDIVVNHSSDEHPWFKESRSSRDNPYRDYYHWWPAEKGEPPYRYSLFDAEGNAWKYDEKTDAYYLHYFSQKQPDLNWENPKVRQEVYDIMTYWAEKGVDGFRLDAFQFAAKDTTFPEFPKGFEKNFIQYYAMQDGLHDYLKEMNEQVFSKYDVMSVAEGAGRTLEEAHELVDADRNEINMAYAFDGVDIPKAEGYKLSTFKETFSKWDSAFADKGWISIFLSNHDQARMVSRYANDSLPYRAPSAKMLNTFILSMRGTPYCYFGDELGMTNNPKLQNIEDYQDIAAINGYKKAKSQGEDMETFIQNLRFGSRDHGRTPMQWDASEHAGFTSGNPWLPINPNYVDVNTEAELADKNSVLNHFKKMTALRRGSDVLIYGDYALLLPEHPHVHAYTRSLGDEQFLVILNFSKEKVSVILEELGNFSELKINNYSNLNKKANELQLEPYQAVILAKS
ncbi:glycoside hydrolase family 13 protein [Leeuwenhoekiella palythoae]|uniref:Oligo-1,6-glucosidase n=1 Tax=Leeuwenhoekiella palythoae TaxID=573501 RepID=A0A1M5Z1W6_9FLAO|nr:alpha-glucosidase [Leeuwenhoekiella palythoae]RXG29805.1 oligo-1,6-glucosidase [Leeuwenhoekiella palythoae]SHI18226.1 oligo-1,6-glucosidase [Leeuwenhoekiella palythoae]